MAYKKQNFARGQTLYASQLNAMDGQIAANEAAIKENKRAIEALPSGGGTTLTGAQATTLGAGSAATAEIIDTVDGKVLKIGVPRGEKGDKGDTGPQGAQANVDTTLTVSGAAADAAAVGTRFGAVEGAQTVLEGRVTALEGGSIAVDATLTQTGKAADAKAVGDAVQGLQAAHDNLAAQVGAIQPGLTQAEKSALLTLLGGAAYGSAEMKASYDALSALWEGGDAPEVVPVQSVTISQGTLTLTVGDTATLTATVLPDNATDKTVTWTVSPSGFARVVGGVVTAQAAGSCTVTASCGGKSASCAVTVESAIKEVTVDTAIAGTGRVWNTRTPLCQSLFVPLTMKQDFTLKKLDFMINLAKNTNIEVSFYNKTEGKNEGTNVTLAGTEGDYHAVVDFGGVDVLAGNEYQIWLNSTEKDAMCYPYVRDAVIAENDYFDITGTAYRWNNSVIKYLGYVVLTQDTSANIEVKSITLSQNALTLRVGGSATLKATVVPSNATDRKVVWSVSPSGYATVTDGEVSATAAGNCVITATAGGKSATCAVTVEAAVTPTVLYELLNETTLVSSSKQSIDTGVKLFENAGTEPPAYTILLDMAVASDISYNANLSPCIMHAYDEAGDKMGTNLAIWGNGKVMLSYNGDTQAFAGVTKPADMFTRAKYAIQINGLKIRSCKAGALGDWTTGTNALENIDETLLFGAGRGSDGSLTRYFDGTFYVIKVYSGLLSDDALNEFLQG